MTLMPRFFGYFYPRSPCGERPVKATCMQVLFDISIHALLAESDGRCRCWVLSDNDFYPRSPCGERLVMVGLLMFSLYFYPRSPCGERLEKVPADVFYQAFLSTLSLRRATYWSGVPLVGRAISIHALLAESDANSQQEKNNGHEFLSTLSLRRATELDTLANNPPFISIHALLAESDWKVYNFNKDCLDFYPRSPCGERPPITFRH